MMSAQNNEYPYIHNRSDIGGRFGLKAEIYAAVNLIADLLEKYNKGEISGPETFIEPIKYLVNCYRTCKKNGWKWEDLVYETGLENKYENILRVLSVLNIKGQISRFEPAIEDLYNPLREIKPATYPVTDPVIDFLFSSDKERKTYPINIEDTKTTARSGITDGPNDFGRKRRYIGIQNRRNERRREYVLAKLAADITADFITVSDMLLLGSYDPAEIGNYIDGIIFKLDYFEGTSGLITDIYGWYLQYFGKGRSIHKREIGFAAEQFGMFYKRFREILIKNAVRRTE